MKNSFLNAVASHNTVTQNGAVSHSTSGSLNLDYFSKIGSYRGRSESEVFADLSAAFGENAEMALAMVFYNRLVTRKTVGFFETEEIQKGQGNKDEFIKSLKWLENSYPDVLKSNLWLVPAVGCWKDLWYDSPSTKYSHYVNTEWVYELVAKGIADEYNRALVAKYLPRIRSKSNVKNERHARLNAWARGLCEFLGWTEKDYRKFKAAPENTAHTFQRQMCAGYWDEINFNALPGKALFNIISRKGKDGKNAIERHGLEEKYIGWIKSKPVAKFTGYIYELYMAAKAHDVKLAQRLTYDAQFEGMLEKARTDGTGLKGNVWCALDTSGSMTWTSYAGGVTPYDICISMGIYFSSLNEGAFKDHVISFSRTSQVHKLSGTFTDKAKQIRGGMGNTNFQSVIDEIVRVRKSNPSIPVEEFPTTLLVVSDMQFDPVGGNTQTNYENAMKKLAAVGLPKMQIIWWNVNGSLGKDVPNKLDDEGVVLLSGFDPTIISLILGGEQQVVDEVTGETRMLTPYENMEKALGQEILQQLQV